MVRKWVEALGLVLALGIYIFSTLVLGIEAAYIPGKVVLFFIHWNGARWPWWMIVVGAASAIWMVRTCIELFTPIYVRITNCIIFWGKMAGPFLVQCEHNGTFGLAKVNFWTAEKLFWDASEKEPQRYENVMTFSDKRPRGEVTGTMSDMESLKKGCSVLYQDFFVPRTSARTASAPVVPLENAKRIIGKQ